MMSLENPSQLLLTQIAGLKEKYGIVFISKENPALLIKLLEIAQEVKKTAPEGTINITKAGLSINKSLLEKEVWLP